jgi:glycosyltransferase involved in cell wall biosynthesis
MITGLLFDADIKNGGSYQMSINNLIELRNNFSNSNLKLVIFTHKKNYILDNLNIDYQIIKLSIFDYIFIFLINFFFFKNLVKKFNICSLFEKKLIKKNVTLVIFLFTSYKSLLLKKVKYTSTVLDVCHREFPEFKEVGNFKTFFFREYLNKKTLSPSFLIITDSQDLKVKIAKLYQLDLNKIISMPNISSKLMSGKKNYLIKSVKKKYNIKNNFYFYPAQFWEHKNHIIILKCIKKLKKKGVNLHFIFCGRDKGNLKFIRKKISEYKINSNIKIFNYIDDKDVWALYKLSKALVMPTYFGPTNIPPVEAWSLNVPVIYSSYLKNHGKKAALYFDPDSEDDLIRALKDLDSIKLKKKLLIAGKRRLIEIQNERKKSLRLFIDIISKNLFHGRNKIKKNINNISLN